MFYEPFYKVQQKPVDDDDDDHDDDDFHYIYQVQLSMARSQNVPEEDQAYFLVLISVYLLL